MSQTANRKELMKSLAGEALGYLGTQEIVDSEKEEEEEELPAQASTTVRKGATRDTRSSSSSELTSLGSEHDYLSDSEVDVPVSILNANVRSAGSTPSQTNPPTSSQAKRESIWSKGAKLGAGIGAGLGGLFGGQKSKESPKSTGNAGAEAHRQKATPTASREQGQDRDDEKSGTPKVRRRLKQGRRPRDSDSDDSDAAVQVDKQKGRSSDEKQTEGSRSKTTSRRGSAVPSIEKLASPGFRVSRTTRSSSNVTWQPLDYSRRPENVALIESLQTAKIEQQARVDAQVARQLGSRRTPKDFGKSVSRKSSEGVQTSGESTRTSPSKRPAASVRKQLQATTSPYVPVQEALKDLDDDEYDQSMPGAKGKQWDSEEQESEFEPPDEAEEASDSVNSEQSMSADSDQEPEPEYEDDTLLDEDTPGTEQSLPKSKTGSQEELAEDEQDLRNRLALAKLEADKDSEADDGVDVPGTMQNDEAEQAENEQEELRVQLQLQQEEASAHSPNKAEIVEPTPAHRRTSSRPSKEHKLIFDESDAEDDNIPKNTRAAVAKSARKRLEERRSKGQTPMKSQPIELIQDQASVDPSPAHSLHDGRTNAKSTMFVSQEAESDSSERLQEPTPRPNKKTNPSTPNSTARRQASLVAGTHRKEKALSVSQPNSIIKSVSKRSSNVRSSGVGASSSNTQHATVEPNRGREPNGSSVIQDGQSGELESPDRDDTWEVDEHVTSDDEFPDARNIVAPQTVVQADRTPTASIPQRRKVDAEIARMQDHDFYMRHPLYKRAFVLTEAVGLNEDGSRIYEAQIVWTSLRNDIGLEDLMKCLESLVEAYRAVDMFRRDKTTEAEDVELRKATDMLPVIEQEVDKVLQILRNWQTQSPRLITSLLKDVYLQLLPRIISALKAVFIAHEVDRELPLLGCHQAIKIATWSTSMYEAAFRVNKVYQPSVRGRKVLSQINSMVVPWLAELKETFESASRRERQQRLRDEIKRRKEQERIRKQQLEEERAAQFQAQRNKRKRSEEDDEMEDSPQKKRPNTEVNGQGIRPSVEYVGQNTRLVIDLTQDAPQSVTNNQSRLNSERQTVSQPRSLSLDQSAHAIDQSESPRDEPLRAAEERIQALKEELRLARRQAEKLRALSQQTSRSETEQSGGFRGEPSGNEDTDNNDIDEEDEDDGRLHMFGRNNLQPNAEPQPWTREEQAALLDGLREFQDKDRWWRIHEACGLNRSVDEILQQARTIKNWLENHNAALQAQHPDEAVPGLEPWIANVS